MDYNAMRGELVLIVEDCRAGAVATGQIGTMEGAFPPPSGDGLSPRIRLHDGSVLWGHECWWKKIELAGSLVSEQADLERWKAVLRLLMTPERITDATIARIALHD
jgi:hypothetical protein